MPTELQDKVIFLTGGAQGIGRECALAYAREGASVVIADIDAEAAAATLAELSGTTHLAVACDVSRRASVIHAVQVALTHFGRLDAVHICVSQAH